MIVSCELVDAEKDKFYEGQESVRFCDCGQSYDKYENEQC
jgi:hypothetical protein